MRPNQRQVTLRTCLLVLNTLSGDRRQHYCDKPRGRQIDVFIDDFDMCNRLALADRLHREPVTIPLAGLFLSEAIALACDPEPQTQ